MTKNYDYVFLSTHDLTQRSTVLLRPVDDIVIFQLTTSRRGRRGKIVWGGIRNAFNSRPHAEVDWMRTRSMQTRRTFNSRPHAEVDHPQKAKRKRIINFQLTTSRRGRHDAGALVYTEKTFNSRPHAEVDVGRIDNTGIHITFNSRPHAEVD